MTLGVSFLITPCYPSSEGVRIQVDPREFLLYYAAATVVALIVVLRGRRPKSRMMLRLRGGREAYSSANSTSVDGPHQPVVPTAVSKPVERPLNVVFNYNGHSWDAYEVLGLPAGSSLEKVEEAFQAQLATVDQGSRPFLEAAYAAIKAPRSN